MHEQRTEGDDSEASNASWLGEGGIAGHKDSNMKQDAGRNAALSSVSSALDVLL